MWRVGGQILTLALRPRYILPPAELPAQHSEHLPYTQDTANLETKMTTMIKVHSTCPILQGPSQAWTSSQQGVLSSHTSTPSCRSYQNPQS